MRISSAGDGITKPRATADHTLNISTDSNGRAESSGSSRRTRWLLFGGLGAMALLSALALMTCWIAGVFRESNSYGLAELDAMLRSMELVIIPRSNWSYLPPADLPQLRHPTPYVVIKHTASPECFGLSQCGRYLREVRELHWQRYQQPEISYNFLIDSVGNVYEGRGWDATNVNKGPVYRCNVDIALIGNFVDHAVPEPMISALGQLLDQGVARGQLSRGYRLLGHNQVHNTISPGHQALDAIKDWRHRCLKDCFEGVQCPEA